jgi:hypothetical protein
MRTFIDVRFYITASEHVSAQDIANQLASGVADVAKWKVDGFRMLRFGAEDAEGKVVQLGNPPERRD